MFIPKNSTVFACNNQVPIEGSTEEKTCGLWVIMSRSHTDWPRCPRCKLTTRSWRVVTVGELAAYDRRFEQFIARGAFLAPDAHLGGRED